MWVTITGSTLEGAVHWNGESSPYLPLVFVDQTQICFNFRLILLNKQFSLVSVNFWFVLKS
jgi:hypothetical protein